MAREITAGVLLTLKDQFSSQIKGAGVSVQGFADKAVGVAEKINKAFSGVAGTLGTLGVSIGVGAAVKSTIDLDHRMARLGLTANASAADVNKLKRQIFETAQMPDIKIDPGTIISGLEVVMTKVGDLEFVQDNVRNVALALQASGESGEAMGAVFAEFAKFGYTMDEILPLMNDLIAQGDQGAFTFGEFAKSAPAVFSAFSSIGTTPAHIRKANAAMQILMAGTKSADVAVTALNSTMSELSDPDKQQKLRNLGINVRDSVTGEFRDFNDIMFDIVAKVKKMGNADFFGTIFGERSMAAIRAYNTQGERMYDNLVNLGDTTGLLEQKSATMANTLKSNLQNLQTAFLSFADKKLTGPLEKITDLFNKLAENPERVEAAFKSLALGIGAIAAVRVGAGIISFVASLNKLQSGGGINMSGLGNVGGGAGMPVYVTNWGGAAGSPMIPGAGNGGPVPGTGSPGIPMPGKGSPSIKINPAKMAGAGLFAGVSAAIYEIPQMQAELAEIDRNVNLTKEERGKARGGAKGKAAGSIAGATGGAVAGTVLGALAAGALTGTAIGTAIPGLGNIIGAVIGAGVGIAGYYFGGKAGRAIGAGLGGAAANNEERTNLASGRRRRAGTRRNDLYDEPVVALPTEAQGSPGVHRTNIAPGRRRRSQSRRPANDSIAISQGGVPQDSYYAQVVNRYIQNEVRAVERVPQASSPIKIDGAIELKSELFIDDKGYRLQQQVAKNTTPYKFATGNAQNARLIQ